MNDVGRSTDDADGGDDGAALVRRVMPTICVLIMIKWITSIWNAARAARHERISSTTRPLGGGSHREPFESFATEYMHGDLAHESNMCIGVCFVGGVCESGDLRFIFFFDASRANRREHMCVAFGDSKVEWQCNANL